MDTKTYTTIARRFRPQKFEDVLGQNALKETLKNALKNNTLASAYIFSGSRGTGKTTLARILAKAINCENRIMQFEPCNSCSSCKEISNCCSFEVIEIDGATNRGIDDIRNIHASIGFQTKNNASKIYIIDEVHMLTKEAFNALLKTLEEPSSNTRFFFATTEIHKIPATILSRCQKFELMRIKAELICNKLRTIADILKIKVDPEAISIIAKLSQGSLRDAESLLDQMICFSPEHVSAQSIFQALGLINLDLLKKLDNAYQQQDPAQAFCLAQEFFSSGIDSSLCQNQILEHFRNITLFKTSQQHLLEIKTHEMIEVYTKASQIYSKEALYYLLDYLTNTHRNLSSQNFGQLHLEMLFLHILQTSKRIGIDTIIQKVEALSQNLEQTTKTPTISKPFTQCTGNQSQASRESSQNHNRAEPEGSEKVIQTKQGESAEPKTGPPLSTNNNPEPKSNPPVLDNKKIADDETILQFASVELSAKLKKY